MKFSLYPIIALIGFLGFQSVQAQCTSCDNLVKVQFQASLCISGQYTVQLHDKTIGPVSGSSCASYTDSPQGTTKLKLNRAYTFNLTTVPNPNGGTSSVHLEVSCPPCFKVYIDGEETNVYDGGGPGCSSGQGLSKSLSIVIKSEFSDDSGNAGGGGVSGGSSSGGVGGGFSLGGSLDGMAGEISFSSGTISPDLFTPAILDYVSVSPDVEVVRDPGTNALRQIKAPETLADMITLTPTSYEIRFYPIAQVGAKVGLLYHVAGSPSKTWRFSSPTNNAGIPELTVTETQGTVVSTETFRQDGMTWMAVIPGVRMETRTESIVNGDTQIETTVKHPTTGIVASKVRDTFRAFPWGTEKISTVTDPDGDALTTTWVYYKVSSDTANYSRLKWRIEPDGSWEKYDYHSSGTSNGEIQFIYRPWKNAPATPDLADYSNCHLTTLGYSGVGYFDTENTYRSIRILNDYVGYESNDSRTGYLSAYEFPILEDFPDMDGLDTDVHEDGRITATIRSSPGVPDYLRGRLAYTEEEDGLVEFHTYEKGNYDPVTDTFTPSSSGGHIRENTTGPIKSYESGTDEKTLRKVTITDPIGNVVSDRQQVKTSNGYANLSGNRYGHDPEGHLVLKTTDGRVTYEATWINGRLVSESDEQGITTTYDVFDPEGRVLQETRLGIVTTHVFDPIGRITSTTRSSGGLSLSNATGYDLSGRVVTETSEDGLTSSTVYTQGGKVTTVSRPDTSTEITTRYLDGRIRSVVGTGLVSRYFDYGAEYNGLWTKESVATENSLQWTQKWRNMRGENYRAANSGSTGPVVTITEFDPYIEGRVVSRTVPGEVDILYAYDPDTGARFREARDLNSNGAIDEDTDSITDTVTSYVEENGAWYQQTQNSVFQVEGSSIPTVLSTTRVKLTNLGVGIASVAELIDSQGNRTVRTTAIDRGSMTVTVTTDVPDSDLNAVEITVAGKLSSTTTPTVAQTTNYTDYDALNRLTSVTSPRGVVSTTAYDPTTGQVVSNTTAGNTTVYTYYPNGSVGAGNVATTTLPDAKVIRTSYTLRGEVFRVWGSSTYPVERTYDAYGRAQFLRTYRGGTGWDGVAWPAVPGAADLTEWTYHPTTGLLHKKIDAANKETVYNYYDQSGKLKTRQRARGPNSTYTWSPLGLPENTTHSDDTPPVSRTYDRSGRMKTLVDAAGNHTFAYPDELTVTETISGGILDKVARKAVLDTFGRPFSDTASSGNATHSVGYTYRTDSRLDQVSTGTESATYSYLASSDAIGNLDFKSGGTTRLSTNRVHDASDRLESITHTYGAETQSFGVTEFDSMNRRKKIAREDGTHWDYSYNDKGEVTSGIRRKTATSQNIPGWDYGYDFDEIGNRKTATTNGRTSTYGANPLNQVTTRTVPRAFDIFGKASAGSSVSVNSQAAVRLDEWFSKEVSTANTGDALVPYSVAATDATGTTTRAGGKLLVATPETFVHDDDGNLTSDGRFIYTWDAENRLTAMETHPSISSEARRKLAFSYDAMGRRVSKTVWHVTNAGNWELRHKFEFIHELNGWNILAERSGGTKGSFIRTYAWGTDLSGTLDGAGGVGGLLFTTVHTSGKTFANGMDLNGNVTLLINTADGKAAATYDYGPFGEPLRQSGEYAAINPYRFSTKYLDNETGLLDYGFRYYNPDTGRWLNRDPAGEAGGVNLYSFVSNDGVNRWDLLGLKDFLIGFYGAGSHQGYGNVWFKQIYDDAGGSGYLFSDGQDGKAIKKLFGEIDTNKDKKIVSSELSGHTFKAAGYSWGGPTTTHLTRRLFLKQGQKKKKVEGYELCAMVPFDVVATIDPVTLIKGMKAPETNVARWVNYHQKRKTSLMDLYQNGNYLGQQKFGSFGSRKFHGESWPKADRNINVPVDWAKNAKRQAYVPGSPILGVMPGSQVNHDTITWFVYSDAVTELK